MAVATKAAVWPVQRWWSAVGRNPWVSLLGQLWKLRLARFGLIVLTVFIVAAVFAPWLSPKDPIETRPRDSLKRPGATYWLGADRLGRDQLSRIIWGARVSLSIGVAGVGIATIAGISIGTIAGWTGRWPDEVLMRVMDTLASFPSIVLALTLVSITGGAVVNIIIVIGLVFTPAIARVIRGQVLSEKERDYIASAIATGATPRRVIIYHLLPNTIAPVIVQASIGFGAAILLEASLSFLGVGVKAPTPTWGGMLRNAFEVVEQAPFLTYVPGFAIFIVVLSFNFVGDALRDALDPRLRRGR
jgi:peptide/nickel transport system permease protein